MSCILGTPWESGQHEAILADFCRLGEASGLDLISQHPFSNIYVYIYIYIITASIITSIIVIINIVIIIIIIVNNYY